MKGWKMAIAMVGVVLVVVLLRGCVTTSYLIPSSGMENSLYRGECILVNKWSYGLRLPFMKLWGYHRWADSPVQKEDILVFNNPANLSEPVIDRREVFISRCIGTPGDTLLIDSLFSVIPSEKNAPDQKFLYSYPRQRERQLDSLLSILSIAPNKLLGQDSIKNIRSFSRCARDGMRCARHLAESAPAVAAGTVDDEPPAATIPTSLTRWPKP